MIANRILSSVVLSATFLLAGCGTKPATVPTPTNNSPTSPLSDEECIAYAHRLEELIAAGDATGATAMVDWSAMVDVAFFGMTAEEKATPHMAGARAGTLESAPDTFATIIAQERNGGSYRFLRVRSGPEGKRVLFRMRLGRSRFTYHEIFLSRKEGKCVGYDVYNLISGERQSLLIRRLAILAASAENPNISKKLTGGKAHSKNDVACLNKMTTALNTDRYSDALAAFRELSPSVQREKPYLLFRLRAARQVSNEETIAALEALRAAFPNDPSTELNEVHSLMTKQEFVAAREAIDPLEKSIGGDPFLNVLRAQLFLKEKKLVEADAAAQKAIAADRTLKDAWSVRVTVALKTREFSRVVELLKVLNSEFDLRPAEISDPLYTEFVQSPEYKKWQAAKSATP